MIIIYLTSYVASDMKRLVTSYFTRYRKLLLKMLPVACGLAQQFQHLGQSFLLNEPTLRRQITCLFFSSLSQIIFFILSLPPVVQMQQTNRRCKEEFLHFNIATKICFEKKAFVFQLSCPIKSCFEEAFGL